MSEFKNPISPFDTPDPFVTYDSVTGYYYALFTRSITVEIFRSRHISTIITDGDSKTVYTLNIKRDGIWGEIWAPEMHRAPNGRWYIYTSGRATPEPGTPKYIFVLEGPKDDPFDGEWTFAGIPTTNGSSIDPTIYTAPDKKQYICYSSTGTEYGQILVIRDLVNPYTYGKEHAVIARAELDWELVPPYVDRMAIVEGAFFVEKNGRLFIIYSANGCWSDNYCLGVLEHTGGSLCDADNWKKHDRPIFEQANNVFGPGHASFFKSPDGSEVWCAYHAMKKHNSTATPAPRYFNVQPLKFDATGFPMMDSPIGYDTMQNLPSGEDTVEL